MSNRNILWLDVETTGLEPTKDSLLEVGCFVTNGKLEIISPIFEAVIYHDPTKIESQMNNYVYNMHHESGLLNLVTTQGLELKEAEQKLIEFVSPYVTDNMIILGGNTVHFDKNFLRYNMPTLSQILHYRIIDVSTLRETLEIVYGKTYPKSKPAHRSVADCHDALQAYKKYLREIEDIGSYAEAEARDGVLK